MPTVRRETITPAKAQRILDDHNKRHRPLKQSQVDQIASAIANDQWHENGDTIKFDTNGDLIDGQHRLQAVVQAGTAITTHVVRGLAPDAVYTIDQGLPRTIADAFHQQGEQHCGILAKAIEILHREASGFQPPDPTRVEALQLLAEHPDIRESVNAVAGTPIRHVMPAAIAAWAHYRMSRTNPDRAAAFWDAIANSVMTDRRLPEFALHYVLTRRRRRGPYTQRERIALTIKACNAAMDGRELQTLRWDGKSMPSLLI